MEEQEPQQSAAEADTGLTNARNRIKALRLEKRALRSKASTIEVLKALPAIVAFGALVYAIIVGQQQGRQSQQARDDERFDKALARMASGNSNERLMGVAGLRLFLTPEYSSRHFDILYFLIAEATSEENFAVHQSILDTFNPRILKSVDQKALSRALDSAIERNRALTSDLVEKNRVRVRAQEQVIARPAPRREDLLALDQRPFGLLTKEEMRPLVGTAQIIQNLVRAGASSSNFSRIYCFDCDFSHAFLPKASFVEAYLYAANFSFANLNGANFDTANIEQVKFYGANLRMADLSTRIIGDRWLGSVYNGDKSIELPILECADLRGANLSNRILAWLDGGGPTPYSFWFGCPLTSHAKIDASTKLFPFGMVVSTDLPEGHSLNDVMAPPGQYDLMDDIFGLKSMTLFRGIIIDKFLPYSNGRSTMYTKIYRAGVIDDKSYGWNKTATSYLLAMRSLSFGLWDKGELPHIVAEGIRDQRSHAAATIYTSNGSDKACSTIEPSFNDVNNLYAFKATGTQH